MTEQRKYRIEHVVGKSYKVWIDGKLQEETMGDKYESVQFEDIKIGDKVNLFQSGRLVEYDVIVTGKADKILEILGAKPASKTTSKRNSWYNNSSTSYERLVTTAETGSWQPVKSWDEANEGDKLKIKDSNNVYLVIQRQDSVFDLESESGKLYTNLDYSNVELNKVVIWKQTTPTTDKDSYLRNVFTEDKEAPAAKVIPDHPHRCPHCASPSYNGEWSIDCKGNCSASRS